MNVAEQPHPPTQLQAARRILVVDDHPSFRRWARTLLTEERFEVVGEAENGAAALRLAAELAPEFVLLDIQLPDSDGFEVAKSLLELDPHLRIVLVSIRERDEYGPRIDTSGALGFITKSELAGPVLRNLLE
jgi:DNA-binding NarL/FixJ family response regulator